MRRGASDFELRDVPWIQYFASGYALHGAYWHDVFGTARSHGCVNLAPIDARYVFLWTDPPVPPGWHGINIGSDMGEGTAVEIRDSGRAPARRGRQEERRGCRAREGEKCTYRLGMLRLGW
jgi:hypothetical protein